MSAVPHHPERTILIVILSERSESKDLRSAFFA